MPRTSQELAVLDVLNERGSGFIAHLKLTGRLSDPELGHSTQAERQDPEVVTSADEIEIAYRRAYREACIEVTGEDPDEESA